MPGPDWTEKKESWHRAYIVITGGDKQAVLERIVLGQFKEGSDRVMIERPII